MENGNGLAEKLRKRKNFDRVVTNLRKSKYCILLSMYLRNSRIWSKDLASMKQSSKRTTQKTTFRKQKEQLETMSALAVCNLGT